VGVDFAAASVGSTRCQVENLVECASGHFLLYAISHSFKRTSGDGNDEYYNDCDHPEPYSGFYQHIYRNRLHKDHEFAAINGIRDVHYI